jgi:hypothetical protein
MQFINTNGMAFIGPGSEWFWTAVSGLVLAGTFIAIYRQLRIARSANAWAQLGEVERDADSERMTRYKLEVLLAIRDREDRTDLPEAATGTIANFWEKVALLVRAGHVDRHLLYEQASLSCQRWWGALGPWVKANRAEVGQPKIGENFEWLAVLFASFDRQGGAGLTFDDEYFKENVGRMIAGCRDDLRVWEALRSVIVSSPESVPLEPGPRRS